MSHTYNPFSLENKVILITGASSGIGKATAIECSNMGARVVITARDEVRLKETFNSLKGEGHISISVDISETDGIDYLIDQLPILNGIVHCAGIAMHIPFAHITKEKLNTIFSINYNSPTLISQKIIKTKKIEKNSSIVFISSIHGTKCSSIAGSLYSSTKGAINGLVKGMALDLANKGIRVNTVIPAMINTNIISEGIITEEQIKLDIAKYPLKRYGEPEEVAYAIIYLLSDASKWVTGSNLLIDGGYTLL